MTGWWRLAAALALISTAAGCGVPACPPPAVQAAVAPQKVIVPVACVKRGDIAPEPPLVADRLKGKGAGASLLIVDQSALDLRTWGEGLYGQLLGCAAGAP